MPEREQQRPRVRFVGPPPQVVTSGPGRGARPKGWHGEVARQLRARPGEWAVIDVYGSQASAAGVAYQIRMGGYSAYQPRGAWEAVSRLVDGENRVYARYLPVPDRKRQRRARDEGSGR